VDESRKETDAERAEGDVSGDAAGGAAALFPALYQSLHALAERQLRRNAPGLTISTTTLIHEAWLNVSARPGLEFPTRQHFLAYAARAMRGIVIDYARRRQALKRGRAFEITLAPDAGLSPERQESAEELTRLSDALDDLATIDPKLAELVDLHFFCGYTFGEIAALRDVSERTVQRDWRKARMLLHATLKE
jgi:RNA polymerase sigma factor (TIGR02999 family)